jgi:pyruvate/2-oxoacid:ferredoxin oxidoreductase beta subunit/Pyruvate/2-oxoacid:ferredoxin oxidoreductase gamma subunit
VVHALDHALQDLDIPANRVVIVSDIGCSGLLDTFFNTHALHGLHGRALTYATGIKMARPDLKVIVTMGDGGLGIGGAHVTSTCRRNIDLTLLVLNNFNYGMTGGQCSATTPPNAAVESGFLNRLEKPLDVCQWTAAAGAGWVGRTSVYEKELIPHIIDAIAFEGFSVLDIWGLCTGRYTKRNELSPNHIRQQIASLPPWDRFVAENQRPEYRKAYQEMAAQCGPALEPLRLQAIHPAPQLSRQEVILLGSAGQRILTAGEILCMAGASAGLHASQKNDYPITVMRGHSVTEVIVSPDAIGFTGIERPTVVIALAKEGLDRKKSLFAGLENDTLVLAAAELALPETRARIERLDFKEMKIKPQDWAIASIAWLAQKNLVLSPAMLKTAISFRFHGRARDLALETMRLWESGRMKAYL